MAQQLQEEELRILFNEGIANQFGKKKSAAQSKASALGLAEASKEIKDFYEAISSDDSDEESEDGNDGPIFIDEEPVATVVFREKTIEDIIEEQRAKLAAEGKKGTPVTAETFAVWRKGKLAQKQAEAEARLKAEQNKKKGGKGLCKYNIIMYVFCFLCAYSISPSQFPFRSCAVWQGAVQLQLCVVRG